MKPVGGPLVARMPAPASVERAELPVVLYVEDDPENWAVTQLRLSRRFHLIWAKNDVEACSLIVSRKDICAVLMDIELKGSRLSGIELAQLFQGTRPLLSLPEFVGKIPPVAAPILFVTAHHA